MFADCYLCLRIVAQLYTLLHKFTYFLLVFNYFNLLVLGCF